MVCPYPALSLSIGPSLTCRSFYWEGIIDNKHAPAHGALLYARQKLLQRPIVWRIRPFPLRLGRNLAEQGSVTLSWADGGRFSLSGLWTRFTVPAPVVAILMAGQDRSDRSTRMR